MVHPHMERLKRLLNTSEIQRKEAEAKLADAEAKLEESKLAIASLQASKATLQNTLHQSIQETDYCKQARLAFEEEITILRQRSGEILESNEKLVEENIARKQHKYKTKNSLLRSFKWKEKDVDPVVLEGAVAFWGATGKKQTAGSSDRSSKETRKSILKAIIRHGFGGEVQAELEKDVMNMKRWDVFELCKLSDLESKFNSEALGSIAHCEPGLKKNHQGLLPSATTFNNCLMNINREATRKGFSCMPQTNTWCWGDAEGNTLREGVHRYVKSVYVDAWDERATAEDPYILAVTGDLARVSFSGKAVTLGGPKECDRRLVSQQLTGKPHITARGARYINNMNQSRTLYTPAIGGYSTESDMMPLFEELVDYFVEIEQQQFCVVDGKEYEVFIKVLVIADMMFLQKFTGHGGGCASTTHFCMFCSCMSKFRHEGQPGGCEDCRNRRQVYDNQGLQICLHHDVITPERLLAQRARLRHLNDKLSGTFPARKKPAWENLHGLREACLQRCVPGVTNKDGQDAYDPRDIVAIASMNTKACEAWLNERTEGAVIALLFLCPYVHLFHTYIDFALHYLHARWMYSLQ